MRFRKEGTMKAVTKQRLNIKLAGFVYCLFCNIPVCFFLCMTSSIINLGTWEGAKLTLDFGAFNWPGFFANYALALVLAMCVGTFVPLTAIGRWFTGLFHIENETYKGNMKYRLLATLIITLIYYVVISPTLAVINGIYYHLTAEKIVIGLLIQMPFMLVVGFVSSLINDLGAYKMAHRIDKNF